MYLQISWRNIWRNPKRTSVILAAVIIGTWSMFLFGSLFHGFATATLNNALNTLTGHIQIQHQSYREDPAIENRITRPQPIFDLLDKELPSGARWTPRITLSGITANARNTAGVTIVGIDPKKEIGVSFYGQHMEKGRLLNEHDTSSIIIGAALARSFGTKLKRKMLLTLQDSHGENISRAFKIRGIYHAELEATEKQYVFIPLNQARQMLDIGNDITNISIQLHDLETVPIVTEKLAQSLPSPLVALDWHTLLPIIKGYLSMLNSMFLLWYVISFVAMAFGLVNTILMAVLERTQEFGLLKAMGMQPRWIVYSVLVECFLLLLVGLVGGNMLGFLTLWAFSDGLDIGFLSQGAEYFGVGNIIVPYLTYSDFFLINGIILILGLFICLYPAFKAGKITPIAAMRRTT